MRNFVVLFAALLSLSAAERVQKRSIGPLATIGSSFGSIGSSIGSIFARPTPSPLSKYPLWKVHKYTGVELKPVNPAEEELSGAPEEYSEFSPREVDGLPPKSIPVPDVDAFQSSPYESALGSDHDNVANLIGSENEGGKASLLASLLGIGRSDVAEDKIGLNPLKKKKLVPLGLGALSALLKNGYVGGGSLGGVGGFQSLLSGFGGASGSATGFEGGSTVYRGVPTPSSGGLLSYLPFFGNRPSGTPVVLPEPVLPDIPPLRIVPEAPRLPQLTLPGSYKLPYSTGSYVSIKAPKPHSVTSDHFVPEYSPPATSYGVPDLSTTHYEAPAPSPPVQQYSPSPVYKAPELFNPSAPPAPQYSAPPAPQYSAPPAPQYSAPPAPQYSAPPSTQYAEPSRTYYPQNYRTSYDVAASETEISLALPQPQEERTLSRQESSFNANTEASIASENNAGRTQHERNSDAS